MGAKLVDIYTKAEGLGSLKAKMRLAMLTGIPSAKASEAEDSAENIAKFETAMRELETEFK